MHSSKKGLSIFVSVLFFLGLFYTAYRYPFKINSSVTSPTYSDTPGWLSIGKYIIFSIIMYYFALRILLGDKIVKIYKPIYLFVYSFLFAIPLVSGILTQRIDIIESGIFFLIPGFFHFFSEKLDVKHFNRIIYIAIYVYVFVECLQILLFVLYDRLPALAYEGTFSIRFGSLLDDPNSFGILISFFIGFMWENNSKRDKLLFLLLGIFLLLTQSLTSIFSVMIATIAYILLFIIRYPNRFIRILLVSVVFFLLFSIVTFFNFNKILSTVDLFWEMKLGSIITHLSVIDTLKQITIIQYLGLNPIVPLGESGYINILANMGIVYLLVYIGIGLSSILKTYIIINNKNTNIEDKRIARGIFFFLITVYIAMINLPFEQVFPINIVLTIFVGLLSTDSLIIERKQEEVEQLH
ncbi:hypothetical protein MJA45_22860 [Paenibacillus aurantius]|uniref:Uncharacterized protein n=1 Tax=Paenibacillus aurantius TaxID=2918900 RepID=A0AA96LE38_9BACL|nr:hypothetical protein [Paenibacillus aurantius]WNQ10430.1 hypothetical protein MJA45_22860 [Paenibacillus aurantius]